MARQKRVISNTGIYHVMLKGIDDRNIFIEETDKIQFLKNLEKTRNENAFSLYAYCLMDNHVHILLKEMNDLGDSIKKIAVSYVHYHNKKYDRRGHLFNNRYRSEVIETEDALLRVIAYIHNNPITAGITKDIKYLWSSHEEYLKIYKNRKSWLNISFIKRYYKTLNEYLKAMSTSYENKFIDLIEENKYTDTALNQLINEISTTCKAHEIKNLKKETRNIIIKEIKEKTKASNRQLSRVLGIGRNIIDRI